MAKPAVSSSGRWRVQTVVLIAIVILLVGLWIGKTGSQAFNALAARALQRDDIDGALNWLAWSTRCYDGNPETHFWRARLLRKSGHYDEFVAELDRFIAADGDRELARRETGLAKASLGEAKEMIGELADLLVNQGGDGDEICNAYVNGLLRQNEYQQAFVLIENWKQSYPNDPRPHYSNGRVQDHLNNWPAAEKEYRDALSKQPDHYPSAYSLARLLLANNHPVEALPLFSACRAMKYNTAALIGMAKCHRQLAQVNEARTLLQEAVSRSAEERELSFQRLRETEEGDTGAVELGSLELAAGNAQQALEYLNRAHRANPRDLDVRYARAVALRQTGAREEGTRELEATNASRNALTDADRIVDTIDPLQPQVEERLKVGEIYLQHGSLQTAQFWLESAVSHEPTSVRGRQLLEELQQLFRETAAQTSSEDNASSPAP